MRMSKQPENMIISDPKGELYQYTAKTLERLGYKVYTLDFKNPLKSSRYNFLQPVIEADNNKDTPKAVNYCSDIVESLVGEVGNREAIWINGESALFLRIPAVHVLSLPTLAWFLCCAISG